MTGSTAPRSESTGRDVKPQMVVGKDLGDVSESIYQTIAHRAYELYEARGGQHGHDLEDWFRAEADLQWPGEVKVAESAGVVVVNIELAGFAPEEIKVGIEPHRVIIWGKKERPVQQEPQELSHTASLRVIDLSSEIETTRATLKLHHGRLVLKLPACRSR